MTPTFLALAAALVLALVPAASAQETPRLGGVLKVASIGEPPTLDIPMSTATLVYEIMWHVNESLFTYDKGFNPDPAARRVARRHRQGAAPHDHAPQGRQVPQRQGDDRRPTSCRRSGAGARVASVGTQLWKNVESVEAKDPYTVVISAEAAVRVAASSGSPSRTPPIYPKESIEAAGEGQLKEFIGTGPYRFVEHRPDRHIKLARFKDYSARAEPPSGFGGKRTA